MIKCSLIHLEERSTLGYSMPQDRKFPGSLSLPPGRVPGGAPVVQRQLAPHVQAAQRSTAAGPVQPKLGSSPGGRPLAPHVQAAQRPTAAGPVQSKPESSPGARPPALHVQAAPPVAVQRNPRLPAPTARVQPPAIQARPAAPPCNVVQLTLWGTLGGLAVGAAATGLAVSTGGLALVAGAAAGAVAGNWWTNRRVPAPAAPAPRLTGPQLDLYSEALVPGSRRFTAAEQEVMANVANSPYGADYLNERHYPMRFMHPGGRLNLLEAAQDTVGPLVTNSRRLIVDQNTNLVVTRIRRVNNPVLEEQYEERRRRLRNNRGDDRETILYTGTSADTIERYLIQGGFDTKRTPHHRMKGYGALGLGAYLTDRFGKACTYAPCPQCDKTVGCNCGVDRAVLKCRVLLGNLDEREYTESKLRHSRNDDLVSGRSDSRVVRGSHESLDAGFGRRWTDKRLRGRLDSDEYVVSRSDQILPDCIIYFTIQ